jgi:hypothetical protein
MNTEACAPNYAEGWANCDKEVMAEDYKYRLLHCSGEHRMADQIGNPSTEVREYIESLGRKARMP